jgi:hypothetical protein
MRRASTSAPADQRARIRELFLHPSASYRLSHAARLIGVSRGVLRREAERDDREVYRANGRWCFSWRQVTYIALRRWTLAEIHDALGPAASTVLPPLLSLQTIAVRLPAFLVRAINHEAAEQQTTIDDWLHQELIDFAGTVAHRIERAIPGFRRAYFFPGQE